MRTTIATLVALGLTVSACSAAATEPGSSTTAAPTTTLRPTTSTRPTPTTADKLEIAPLNGLPVSNATLLDRRVLAVKIDNHANSRPHSGIEKADAVVELMVEGVTRFISLWHQSDSEYLGPMRSGRPTDPTLLTTLGATFSISGAQPWVQSVIRSMDVPLIGEVRPATFRISGQRAPHNLYGNTVLLRVYADQRGYPDEPPADELWEFGPMPSDAEPVREVTIDFSGNIVSWTWDPVTSTWLRSADGLDSEWRTEDGEIGRIGFPVLVALYTEQYTASPPGGQSGKAVPASRTTGSGKAFVFAEGKGVEGTWSRESTEQWFTLLDPVGDPLLVPPGQVWISLVPANRGLSYE